MVNGGAENAGVECVCVQRELSSTNPQKPSTTYTRVNDFRPCRYLLFRGATYTWELLIREYIRYVSYLIVCHHIVHCRLVEGKNLTKETRWQLMMVVVLVIRLQFL